eukprot:969073_1
MRTLFRENRELRLVLGFYFFHLLIYLSCEISVKPILIREVYENDRHHTSTNQVEDDASTSDDNNRTSTEIHGGSLVSAKASQLMGNLVAVSGCIGLITNPFWGHVSDFVGRRKMFAVSQLVLSIRLFLVALFPSVPAFVTSEILHGLLGVSVLTSYAAIADLSDDESVSIHYGYGGAALGVSLVTAPLVGILLSYINKSARLVYAVNSAFALVFSGIAYMFYPETLLFGIKHKRSEPELSDNMSDDSELLESNRSSDGSTISGGGTRRRRSSLQDITSTFSWPKVNSFVVMKILLKSKHMTFLSGARFSAAIKGGVSMLWSIVLVEQFGYTSNQLGRFVAVFGLTTIFAQSVLMKYIIDMIGYARTIYGALFIGVIGNIAFVFARKEWQVFALMPPLALAFVYDPLLRGEMAKEVSVTEQGRLQGALMGLQTTGKIIGSFIGGHALAFFIGIHLPEGLFLLNSIFFSCCIWMVYLASKHKSKNEVIEMEPLKQTRVDSDQESSTENGEGKLKRTHRRKISDAGSSDVELLIEDEIESSPLNGDGHV